MSKIKIEIKSWINGSILFEHEKENNSIRDTLMEAVKRRTKLTYANLAGANLADANLEDAYLEGVNLKGAYLEGAYLKDAYLVDANLEGADLEDAYLVTANLKGADLKSAYLEGANLEDANLAGANLADANLEGAYLKDANLVDANLEGADLEGADLATANLEPIKKDFFDVLLRAIPEINNLKNALLTGKIDGSTYEGDCACLCGTLEKSNSEKIRRRIYYLRNSSRPIERFFVNINPGDTPENNQFANLVLQWIEEFEDYINTKFSAVE